MDEFGLAWLASRDRMIAAAAASASDLDAMSSLCPEWRNRDILGHVVGVSQDIAAGNFPADLDAWAAEQVRRNFAVPVPDLLSEWPLLGFEHSVSSEFAIALYDQVTHECDLLHGVGRPAQVDLATLRLLAEFTIGRFAAGSNGLSVSLHLEGDIVTRGNGERKVALHANYFEWFRASAGRRSRSQIDAMDWRGDLGAIDLLFTGIFRPSEADVAEAWQP